MSTAREALERLREGNRRFASDAAQHDHARDAAQRSQLAARQEPFAIVVGCSDSRVPPEMVFDQGLGDLFVIRVAGNVVAPTQIGSVEFAAELLGARLVVVLGHSRCGAILATLDALGQPGGAPAQLGHSILDRVRPAVEEVLAQETRRDEEVLAQQAVRANIRRSVHELRHRSEILAELTRRDGLLVLGAEYSLETGRVTFLEDEPE